LFQAACELGALAGHGDGSAVSALGSYGRHLGRAFQIADDLLDVTATADVMGKGVRKDAAAGKQTYPQAVGLEPSRAAAMQEAQAAVAAIAAFGAQAQDLRLLADYVVDRNY
jgi:geranylgeranyl diphosphate synthase type II